MHGFVHKLLVQYVHCTVMMDMPCTIGIISVTNVGVVDGLT